MLRDTSTYVSWGIELLTTSDPFGYSTDALTTELCRDGVRRDGVGATRKYKPAFNLYSVLHQLRSTRSTLPSLKPNWAGITALQHSMAVLSL